MFGDTPLVIVEDTETLARVVADLMRQPVIGIDTESDSFHHYQEKVCLIQLSDLQQDYIVDPLKIDDLSPLQEVLESRDIVKVLHGADYDVVCLKRDYDFQIKNIFDTMIAAQFLGFPKVGLADLIDRFFGVRIDKKYQRHDWARRPLEEEHLQYARGDTHWILAIREALIHKLEQAGRRDHVEEECRILEDREWSGRGQDPADFLRVKRSGSLDKDGLRVLRALWHYRDEQARRMDRPTFKVMPDAILLSLAQKRPRSDKELYKVLRKGSGMSRKHGPKLLDVIEEGLNDDTPLPTPKKKKKARKARSGAGVERLMGPLKDWRNRVVDEQSLAPVVVASNQMLKEVARAAPKSQEELRAVPGVRDWQVEDFGEEILAVVAQASPQEKKKKKSRRKKKVGADSD